MKNFFQKYLAILLFAVILLPSCAPIIIDTKSLPTSTKVNNCDNLPDPESVSTPQPVFPLQEAPTIPSWAELPTPTYIPIKTPDPLQREILFESLKSDSCMLPCFFDIYPGATSWFDAKNRLENMGLQFEGLDESSPGVVYRFVLYFWQESYGVSILVEDKIVQRFSIRTINNRNPDFYKNWDKYSLANTIKYLGNPDDVFFRKTYAGFNIYTIMINYKSKKMSLIWHGDMQERNGKWFICPVKPTDKTWNFDFTMTNPKNEKGIFQSEGYPYNPFNNEYWRPINVTYGIDERQFYEMLIADPNACIRVNWE